MYEQPFNPFAKNLAVVKDYFKSGSVLALAVTRAIILVLSAITAVIGASSASGILNNLSGALQELDLPSDQTDAWSEVMSRADTASAASNIISYIPSLIIGLLVVAALFLIYSKSRNASPESSPKAGVTILYVLSVISLVATIIIAVLGALAVVIIIWALATASSQFSSSSPMTIQNPTDGSYIELSFDPAILTVVAVIMVVVLVIALVIALVYVVNMKRYYGSIKASITTVELQNRGAKPFGVLTAIAAVFSAFGLLSIPSSFLSIGILHLEGAAIVALVLAALIQIASFVALILEAKIALGYSKYIENVKYGYNAPTPPAAPYVPFPGSAPGYAPAQNDPYQNSVGGNAAGNNPYADPYGAPAPVCPACGAPVDPKAPFCGNCGNKL